jgi:regulator of sirC expression with transglutaminase-like and TPR domain
MRRDGGDEPRSRKLFSDMVGRPDEAVDLAQAALLIACEEYPGLDPSRYVARLDEMGDALRQRLEGGQPPEAVIAALNRYLFDEEGFHGNAKDYYNPRNSFLNDVLDRRTGIPITLSTVYMEVASRVGLNIVGVGLPGHFIVKAAAAGREILIDPFQNGAVLSEEDCQRRVDRVFKGRVKVEAEMLAGCRRKDILERMLRNLKLIYSKREDWPRALGVVELLLRLQPESAEDLRDRGLLYAALDCYALAVRDLETYLERVPVATEAQDLRNKVAGLRHRAARVN